MRNGFNPKKAGGSKSIYSLGGRFAPPPLENRYRAEMHVHSPIFQGQLIEKKIRSITFIVCVLERVEKKKKNLKQISKCGHMFLHPFSRAF